MSQLFRTKSIDALIADSEQTGRKLERTLGPWSLTALGIGAVIGSGIFTLTGTAASGVTLTTHSIFHAPVLDLLLNGQNAVSTIGRPGAGPAVALSFVILAIICGLAGLCYAEFASMIPIAGSAYTYSYTTMGEFIAWIIGWDLVLEYAVGAATVAIAWSQYLNKLLAILGISPVPYQWSHSPMEVSTTGVQGLMNLPAVVILLLLSLVLVRGTQESALLNGIIVIAKVAIVMMVIAVGWGYMNPLNHTPYIPEATTFTTAQGVTHAYGGVMGVLGAAGVVFFAYIGFDAVSTAAQEAKNPSRDMPIGILGSLAICTILYILFAHVLSGVAPVEFFRTAGKEASVSQAIADFMPGYGWLSNFVTVAILAGFSSVILVMLLGQSRVFYSMSRDGLVPKVFSDTHPKYRTPWKSNMLFFVFTSLFAAFLPDSIVGEMTSIGTLFAFMLVCAGVWILRVRRPDLPRAFKVPIVPVVAILGIVVCGAMIYGLGWTNWLRLGVWLAIGVVIYFVYGKKHSKLANDPG